ncbi:MAG: hypothetical protein K5984_07620 [Bacteroidales bacterium]|nr:hypothetical protein [Bacteroidales bacterium]
MFSDKKTSAPVLPVLLIVFSALFSCTVLEDRELCPCYITFDLGSVGEPAPDYLLLSICGEGDWTHTDTVHTEDGLLEYYVPVPRGNVDVMVIDQQNRGFVEGQGLCVKPGLQFPRARMEIRSLDASGEMCTDTVRLHKNYCQMTVRLIDPAKEGWPFTMKLISDCTGYAFGGSLVQGNFWAEAVPDEDGVIRFSVPRQFDDLMRVEILTRDKVLRTFSLGTVLTAARYDWTKEDLDDVEMELDFASASIAISVDKWSSKQYFNLVI